MIDISDRNFQSSGFFIFREKDGEMALFCNIVLGFVVDGDHFSRLQCLLGLGLIEFEVGDAMSVCLSTLNVVITHINIMLYYHKCQKMENTVQSKPRSRRKRGDMFK